MLGCRQPRMVGGVAMAAGPATRRYPGRSGGRQRNRGRNARCDCARSSVSAVRDGTARARGRHSDGCGVVFPACFQRTPATRFTVGAGHYGSARRRRAHDPYRSRGARRIPPGQSRFRSASSGHRAFRWPQAIRCRPFGVIGGCRPSEGIARHSVRGALSVNGSTPNHGNTTVCACGYVQMRRRSRSTPWCALISLRTQDIIPIERLE